MTSPSLCEFVTVAGGVRCRHCCRFVATTHSPDRVHAPCPQPPDWERILVGAELESLIAAAGEWTSRLGFPLDSSSACQCAAHARQMDAWGPDECERRADEIVGWLVDGWRERTGLCPGPAIRFAARRLLRLAIARARSKQGPAAG